MLDLSVAWQMADHQLHTTGIRLYRYILSDAGGGECSEDRERVADDETKLHVVGTSNKIAPD